MTITDKALLPIPEAEGGKRYHMAKLINQRGGVSPWCAKTPRPVNLKRETWTNRWEAVTCPKCLRARAAAQGGTNGKV